MADRSVLRRFLIPALFVAGLFAVTLFRDRPKDMAQIWEISGPTMGTEFNVKIVADDIGESGLARVEDAVLEVLDEVDLAMSTWRDDSELSRFNRSEGGTFEASPALQRVVAEALRVAAATNGAFDPTVGPLVDAWGFGKPEVAGEPGDERVSEVQALIGWRGVTVDEVQGALLKSRAEIRLDLSAIAKGWAVDQVSERLVGLGYADHMVEVGGEVKCRGRNQNRERWRIGIEAPEFIRRKAFAAVVLADEAMATSGDYRNFRMAGGRRVSHTIDPRSGRPIEHDLASVSVIANSCMTADAWATALTVLGPAEGLAIAEREDLDALFIRRTASGFDDFASPGWIERPDQER